MIDIGVYSRVVGNATDDLTLSPVVLTLFKEEITVAELIERDRCSDSAVYYVLSLLKWGFAYLWKTGEE